jgi:integrase
MPRAATKLTHLADGGWLARKRIPSDCMDQYERLYQVRWEARATWAPMPLSKARVLHREWLSTIETRITNIRAGRTGDGLTLNAQEARALSGRWYAWWLARELPSAGEPQSEEFFSEVVDHYRACVAKARGLSWHPELNPHDLWHDHDALAKALPFVADRFDTSQFLADQGLKLDEQSRVQWLRYVAEDGLNALKLIARRGQGDWSADRYTERFSALPPITKGSALSPLQLFEAWIRERQPEPQTIAGWRPTFAETTQRFPKVTEVTPELANDWVRALVTKRRSARTINTKWIRALITIWNWGIQAKLVEINPFVGLRLAQPRKTITRDSGKAFTPEEATVILSAASAIECPPPGASAHPQYLAAKHWIAWLAAYTGARVGELCQLRACDIVPGSIPAITITPEAGTQKRGRLRVVPLHPHVVDLGFLKWVAGLPKELPKESYLFCNQAPPPKQRHPRSRKIAPGDITRPTEHPALHCRRALAQWVRSIGVKDRGVSPNHGWRHTFKQMSRRHKLDEVHINAIGGWSNRTVEQDYGAPTLQDKYETLKLFPRYSLK